LHYIFVNTSIEDRVEPRNATREAHLEYLKNDDMKAKLALAGSTTSGTDCA
tara:strand:+ start:173 stop:325 length:153 start_codon:yes stop_codon:yes gene_type:complete